MTYGRAVQRAVCPSVPQGGRCAKKGGCTPKWARRARHMARPRPRPPPPLLVERFSCSCRSQRPHPSRVWRPDPRPGPVWVPWTDAAPGSEHHPPRPAGLGVTSSLEVPDSAHGDGRHGLQRAFHSPSPLPGLLHGGFDFSDGRHAEVGVLGEQVALGPAEDLGAVVVDHDRGPRSALHIDGGVWVGGADRREGSLALLRPAISTLSELEPVSHALHKGDGIVVGARAGVTQEARPWPPSGHTSLLVAGAGAEAGGQHLHRGPTRFQPLPLSSTSSLGTPAVGRYSSTPSRNKIHRGNCL